MNRALAVGLVLVAACGRFNFDERDDGGGTSDSLVVTDAKLPSTFQYGKASNPGAGDIFGTNVALSRDGTTLAVASLSEDSATILIGGPQNDDSALSAGAVYVFVRAGNTWVQQEYLKPNNTGPFDQFGRGIAISSDGNTIAVSANLEDGLGTGVTGNPGDNSGMDTGAAYIFVRNGTTWSQQAYLKASNTENGDDFGTSIALSANGNQLAVGAFNEASASTNQADNTAPLAGAVYTYTRSGTTWAFESYVKASNAGAGDRFGESVALSDDGQTLAVGAPLEAGGLTGINPDGTDNSLTEAGAVYVFRHMNGTWFEEAYIKPGYIDMIPGGGAYDQFGWSVALDINGNTLAVGARLEQSNSTGVNGDPTNNDATGSGAAYVFVRSGTTWSQQAYIKAGNPSMGDFFGELVALSATGDLLAVGSPFEDGSGRGFDPIANDDVLESGAIYTYRRVGSTWLPLQYIKSPSSDGGDQFRAVSVNGDGHTIVIGGMGEDGASTGFGGNAADNSAMDSGAVYVIE